MKANIITSFDEIKWPHRLFYLWDDISDENIELLIEKWLVEIQIYSKKWRVLEEKIDLVIVWKNIEKNISLNITTISFDYQEESIQDALLLFSNNHRKIENNYIFLEINYEME